VELIAHRGFAAERAENTIPALERAAGLADVVEFDVRRCASGEPVVVHDATVDRVTGATGPVADFTAAELAAMDVLGSGAGIPTLAAVLEALPDDVTLFVELKETGIADAVLAELADREGRAVCSSFQPAALREVRAADPSVTTAYIAGRLRDAPVTTATELDADQIHVRARLAAHPRIRRAARRLGIGVYAWTARTRASALLLTWLGVDGITSDRSDVLPMDR
jgi:glycerophosphoryl diester phosphodiesterase